MNFLSDLKEVNFQSLCLPVFSDPNDALTNLYSLFNAVLDKHAKVKTKRVKYDTRPKWFTQEPI